MTAKIEDTPSTETQAYGLIVGGYRVKFTNWQNGNNEKFFSKATDAVEYLAKFRAYGYKGTVETIHFHIKEDI